MQPGCLAEGLLRANGNCSRPAVDGCAGGHGILMMVGVRISGNSTSVISGVIPLLCLSHRGARSCLRISIRRHAEIDKPTGIHAVHRHVSLHRIAKIRRGESNRMAALLAAHHHAFHGMGATERFPGVMHPAVAQQVADVAGAPHACLMCMIALAPCATLGFVHALQRIGRFPRLLRHLRLPVKRNARHARTGVIHHVQLKHTRGERKIANRLEIALLARTHVRVGTKHKRAHADLAHHLPEE